MAAREGVGEEAGLKKAEDLTAGVIIDGTFESGLGKASQFWPFQGPHLIRHFPEIKNCHPGTINIRLVQPLRIHNPDYTTPPIPWVPNNPNTEWFSFLRIALELPIGASHINAWVIIPQIRLTGQTFS